MVTKYSRIGIPFLALLLACSSGEIPGQAGSAGGEPLTEGAENHHTEVIESSRRDYVIEVGGTLDMDRTLSRDFFGITIGYQNNVSLTLENTGPTPVRNPRIVANDRGRWWNMDVLLDEALEGAQTGLDSILFIQDFVQENRIHAYPMFTDDSMHDPVAMFNEFGSGFCDDAGFVTCSMLYHAGLDSTRFGADPRVLTLKGHMMAEASSEHGFLFLDTDQNAFYLDFANERPASGRALAEDHYLVKREFTYGPVFRDWDAGQRPAALFGADDGHMFRAIAGRAIDFVLRPEEKITYRWEPGSTHPTDGQGSKAPPGFWGTSLWTYRPSPAHASADTMIVPMDFPYAIAAARLIAGPGGFGPDDLPAVMVSIDDSTWTTVPPSTTGPADSLIYDLSGPLGLRESPPRYRFVVRTSPPAAAGSLVVEAELMTWPLALPRLRCGINRISYQDDNEGSRQVTVTHRWRESSEHDPPGAPAEPLFPADGQTVTRSTVPFAWSAVAGAADYHIQVSRRADMRLPYRPAFNAHIDTTAHHAPFTGLFNPGEDYFWRVRSRNDEGTWSDWSPTWSFRWRGPAVPLETEAVRQGRRITLRWKANPRGTRPQRYEIYGSDERGFTPSSGPHEVEGLGLVAGNLIASTTGDSLVVVDPQSDTVRYGQSHYRVVAIDAYGTASGPSPQVALPHPFIVSTPPTEARIGNTWEYRPVTLVSVGDLQWRYVEPHYAYWEREGYVFEMAEGPDWLTWDAESGILRGSPGPGDEGIAQVRLVCRRIFPHEVAPEKHNAKYFLKSDPSFQAEDTQTFEIMVLRGRS